MKKISSKNARLTIEIMQQHAEDNGGKCLSEKYKNSFTKLKWECKEGHQWMALPVNIRNNKTWCPYCFGLYKTIEDMKKIALKRQGECLSEKYIKSGNKLKWRCLDSHIFFMTYDAVKQGQWCPKCRFFYSEELCRTTFEQIFNEKFEKHRHKWLVNSKGNLMELDGFSEKLKIAFEYQGEQHFKVTWHVKDKDILFKRKKDDQKKVALCVENNVHLVIISYRDDLTNLPQIIRKELLQKTSRFNSIDFNKEIDFDKVYSHKTSMEKMREAAKNLGGKCLSKKYLGAYKKLKWKCKNGHIWEAVPRNIYANGSWCGECRRGTIEEFQSIAVLNEGKCLSKKYINSTTKLEYQCKRLHRWKAEPKNTKSGSWCPKCARIDRRGDNFLGYL